MTDILQSHGVPTSSYSRAVQAVEEKKARPVRLLLKDLVDESVEPPSSAIACKLATKYLVQKAVRHHVQTKGAETLLPFTLEAYREAVQYAQEHEAEWTPVETEEPAEGDTEASEKPKKRGRKGGGVFETAKQVFLDNPDVSRDQFLNLCEDKGLKKGSAQVYWYKLIKLHKQGEL